MKFEKLGTVMVIVIVFFAFYFKVDLTIIMFSIIIASIFEYILNKK